MVTFILIIAVSLGLAFGINTLFLEKRPRGAFVTALITAAIAIVSAVIGLVVSAVIIEKMGYQIAVEKAIGPSIGVALFATWGTLKRRKGGEPQPCELSLTQLPNSNPSTMNDLVPQNGPGISKVSKMDKSLLKYILSITVITVIIIVIYNFYYNNKNPSDTTTVASGISTIDSGKASKGLDNYTRMINEHIIISYLKGEITIDVIKFNALKGDKYFQNILGVWYMEGKNVPVNYDESYRWFFMAANLGDSDAQNSLGELLAKNGNKYRESAEWYRKAGGNGHAMAQTTLGGLYEKGRGVRRDLVEAYAWYSVAEASGSGSAKWSRLSVERKISIKEVERAQARAKTISNQINKP